MRTENAIVEFEKAARLYGQYMISKDSKKANRAFDVLYGVAKELRNENKLISLQPLLYSDELPIRYAAATYYLLVDPSTAIEVLRPVANDTGVFRVLARMTLDEWEKGSLELFRV